MHIRLLTQLSQALIDLMTHERHIQEYLIFCCKTQNSVALCIGQWIGCSIWESSCLPIHLAVSYMMLLHLNEPRPFFLHVCDHCDVCGQLILLSLQNIGSSYFSLSVFAFHDIGCGMTLLDVVACNFPFKIQTHCLAICQNWFNQLSLELLPDFLIWICIASILC